MRKDLPGLIEEYAKLRANQSEAEAIDEWGDREYFEKKADAVLATINAILGVAE